LSSRIKTAFERQGVTGTNEGLSRRFICEPNYERPRKTAGNAISQGSWHQMIATIANAFLG
jgi:hypothetical protein